MGTQNTAKTSISIHDAYAGKDRLCFIDVRKPKPRWASGFAIKAARYRHPFDALNWTESLPDEAIVVYCVHGHEVSQAVCGYLRDQGYDARYLEGGFEAWRQMGYAVELIGEGELWLRR